MELFKTFLEDTSGKHLFNFWLDAERYKESLESEPEDTLREQMTRLFRWACVRSSYINVNCAGFVNLVPRVFDPYCTSLAK